MAKKRILIIGALSGIAKEVARAYATKGNDLILTSRNKDEIKNLAKDLKIRGASSVIGLFFDPIKLSSQRNLLNEIFDRWQQGPSVTLISYGIMLSHKKSFYRPEEISKIVSVNFTSVIIFCELLWRELPNRM